LAIQQHQQQPQQHRRRRRQQQQQQQWRVEAADATRNELPPFRNPDSYALLFLLMGNSTEASTNVLRIRNCEQKYGESMTSHADGAGAAGSLYAYARQ